MIKREDFYIDANEDGYRIEFQGKVIHDAVIITPGIKIRNTEQEMRNFGNNLVFAEAIVNAYVEGYIEIIVQDKI